jgi:hypothetical protein
LKSFFSHVFLPPTTLINFYDYNEVVLLTP